MGSKEEKLKLIVLKSALEFGKLVDENLKDLYQTDKSFIIPTKETWFSDGHGKVELLDTVREDDVYIFQDIGNYSMEYKMHGIINHTSPNDLNQQLKDTIGSCKCHPKCLSIIMPLLFAGRQHRRIGREALSCAANLRDLDIDPYIKRIITYDAHDVGVQQALSYTEFENIYATNEILEAFINETDINQLKDVIFVAPDAGAASRRDFFLNSFSSEYIKKDAGSFYKKRDYNKIVDGKNPIIEHSYSGNPDVEGKTAIVIDDMIASGGSMFDVIDELKKRGVAHIYVIASFALFTEGIDKFKKYYEDGKFDGIYTTNVSYIDPKYKEEKWLHVVDCSKHLARVIHNLHEGESISELMKDRSYPSKVLAKKIEEENKN
ncbi:MAG: ribose-phosphate diphosphokinase [Bacilli bacterium]|nr:ribose-phosphate diphosphokinase [Bacilli bacterium]MBO6195745.1 ribose-phosphate diphosphokinase [Bacilli bacterium]